ncbi:MAG: hypothetical protein LBE35_01810, partial [Clostridiales bacterium]|nr:hypothetical protein [Clostridiales bacterium]
AYDYFAIRFCLYLLESVVSNLVGKEARLPDLSRVEIEYALRHTDISKEALIAVFETFYHSQRA